MKIKNIPAGSRDLIFDKCIEKNTLIESIIKNFKDRGYSEIITPYLEYADVFSQNKAFDTNTLYKMIDTSNSTISLRADSTTPIARVVATRLNKEKLPLKLYYNQSVFRASNIHKGKLAQITQCGTELIGQSSIAADTDIISLAIETLSKAIGDDFKIEIGFASLFNILVKECNISSEDESIVRSLIENKNFTGVRDVLEKYGEKATKLIKLPELFGDITVLDTALSIYTSFETISVINYLKELYANLKAKKLDKYVVFDLGLVQKIEYYTGIIFSGYISGKGESILSGGRYDSLIGKFGYDVPACGFAINIEPILDRKAVVNIKDKPLRIAVTKGRLEKKTLELLENSGIPIDSLKDKGRKLIFTSNDGKYELLLAKASDVITYVEHGVCDLGIVGKDTILENGSSFYEIKDLGFGRCKFALAGKKGDNFYEGYDKKIIATKYPNVTKDFFDKKGIDVEIIKIEGSVELAPILELSNAIVDIVETGNTLYENGLEVYEDVAEVSARLIANVASMKLMKKQISNLLFSIQDGKVN
ncbi:MAG: ATP phosphoribosyltransferase regulatory subunit [Clostridia bacterium]